jgi:hypothetical protein
LCGLASSVEVKHMRLELSDPALAALLTAYLRRGGLKVTVAGAGVLAVHPSVANDKTALRRLQVALQVWVSRRPTVEVRVVSVSLGLLARLRAFAQAA